MTFPRPRAYAASFEAHASREAIEAYIDIARKKQTEIQNELGWLEALYLRRVQDAPVRPRDSAQSAERATKDSEGFGRGGSS